MTAMPLDTDVAIETPEHVVFRYQLAGPARRAVAHALDLAICYGSVAIVLATATLASVGATRASAAFDTLRNAATFVMFLVLFCVQWLYFAAFEAATGRTPGKLALGLQVVTSLGRPVGLRAAALRNILRAADLLPTAYVLGVVTMFCSERFQRIGDLVAGTIVVVPHRARTMTRPQIWPPPTDEEVDRLPRQVVFDADERRALELFLRRRGKLGTVRENELAAMVVDQLSGRPGVRGDQPARTLELLYHRALRTEHPNAKGPGVP